MLCPSIHYSRKSWVPQGGGPKEDPEFLVETGPIWVSAVRSKRSNQSILKEISPEYSLEGLMLKLKLQYLGHLIRRVDSLEKTLILEGLGAGEGDDRGWDGWMASSTQWTWVWVDSGSWWWTGRPGVLQSMGSQRVGHDWATELNRSVTHKLQGSEVGRDIYWWSWGLKMNWRH